MQSRQKGFNSNEAPPSFISFNKSILNRNKIPEFDIQRSNTFLNM